MLFAFLLVIFCGLSAWLVFSIVAYTAIYGSLIFAYYCIWDDDTRKAICPNGLLSAILRDE